MSMIAFFEAASLTPEEKEKLAQEIEGRISAKLKDGTLTEREVREIEEMRLRPLPDIQDVQSVYENHLFDAEK
jgi:flagellar basal body-associated protein FliL